MHDLRATFERDRWQHEIERRRLTDQSQHVPSVGHLALTEHYPR
jgi:hypothetical protein